MHELRFSTLYEWLQRNSPSTEFQLEALPGDASFRKYYRLRLTDKSFIVMDAPPGIEDVKAFIAVAALFSSLGVCVPQILAADIDQGFLLLTDFGNRLYFNELTTENADTLYSIALDALLKIQYYKKDPAALFLPVFDRSFMQRELQFFNEWFLDKHVKVKASTKTLLHAYDFIISAAEQQPQLCVHRDYHSRNLLVLPNNQVGVLDFQDAVWGPATYDVVSLLRDCYIAWPRKKVESWVTEFCQKSLAANIMHSVSVEQYLRWFDLMGIQRHLKAIFIFARKFHRDNSSNYLTDIPRTLQYILETSAFYPELTAFRTVLTEEVAPQIIPVEITA